jgi:hypothetical protein
VVGEAPSRVQWTRSLQGASCVVRMAFREVPGGQLEGAVQSFDLRIE